MIIPVDPTYNPNLKITISSSTELGPGIRCAKFLGARGSRTQFEKLYNKDFTGEADRRQIARNLYLHAEAMNLVKETRAFNNYRLIVSEGIYEPTPQFEYSRGPKTVTINRSLTYEEEQELAVKLSDPEDYDKIIAELASKVEVKEIPNGLISKYVGETPAGVNDLKRTGRAVVYQLIDKNGRTDSSKTFDLAVFWKDYLNYDKLTLDYDTYDISGALTSQIILEMPEVPYSYEVSFGNQLATYFNGALQSKADLVEILSK